MRLDVQCSSAIQQLTFQWSCQRASESQHVFTYVLMCYVQWLLRYLYNMKTGSQMSDVPLTQGHQKTGRLLHALYVASMTHIPHSCILRILCLPHLDYGADIWYSASTVRIDQNQGK